MYLAALEVPHQERHWDLAYLAAIEKQQQHTVTKVKAKLSGVPHQEVSNRPGLELRLWAIYGGDGDSSGLK